MKIFVAASYSSNVNYETGEVFPEYREWLEENLVKLEKYGHEIFCALRADEYKINSNDPAEAFRLDESEINTCDGLLSIISSKSSEGVQTEIGIALGRDKFVVIAHELDVTLGYFNKAIIRSGRAKESSIPFTCDPFSG